MMNYKVKIEATEHEFEVAEGQNILDAALDAGIVLPYSCRSASCTSCKGTIVSGKYEAGAGTEALISSEEQEQGMALFCETKAKSDLLIKAREVRLASDIVVKKMPSRVLEMEPLGRDAMVLKLQLPSSEPFRFMAGQYIDLIFKGNKRRSYSMASRPDGTSVIELHIRHIPGGFFTDHVFGAAETQMKPREILRAEGPLGSFFLREESQKPIVFVVSGTGFAPVKAMIEEMIEKQITRPFYLYWGGRRPIDLYMDKLAKQWAEELPQMQYIPVVSEALEEDQWEGRTGFVHQAVLDDFDSLQDYQVYACGAPAMVAAAEQAFIQSKALPEEEFFADSFTTEADNPNNQ